VVLLSSILKLRILNNLQYKKAFICSFFLLFTLQYSIAQSSTKDESFFGGSGSKEGSTIGLRGTGYSTANLNQRRYNVTSKTPILKEISSPNQYHSHFARGPVRIIGQERQFFKIQARDGTVGYVNMYTGLGLDVSTRNSICLDLSQQDKVFDPVSTKTFLIRGIQLFVLDCTGLGLAIEWRKYRRAELIKEVQFSFQLLDKEGKILSSPNGGNLLETSISQEELMFNITQTHYVIVEGYCNLSACCVKITAVQIKYTDGTTQIIDKNIEKYLEY